MTATPQLTRSKHNFQPGQRFGLLTVVQKTESYQWRAGKKAQYLCRCECGKEQKFLATMLAQGRQDRCKVCAIKNRPQARNAVSAERRVYNLSVVQRSKKLDLPGELLSFKDWSWLVIRPCIYCGSEPKEKTWARNNKVVIANGIDRLDSDKGYIKGNCVPCCEVCNRAKNEMSVRQFKEWLFKAYLFNKERYEEWKRTGFKL